MTFCFRLLYCDSVSHNFFGKGANRIAAWMKRKAALQDHFRKVKAIHERDIADGGGVFRCRMSLFGLATHSNQSGFRKRLAMQHFQPFAGGRTYVSHPTSILD